METPLLIWGIVIVIGVCAALIHAIRNAHKEHRRLNRHRIITMGDESQEMFVPGDHIDYNA